jgi:DNA-binding NarL/FixJ family response regulator
MPPAHPSPADPGDALEAERRRIATLLDARLAEPLTTLIAQATAYEQLLTANPEASTVASVLNGQAARLQAQLRALTAALYPPLIDAVGLPGALEALADQMQRQAALPVQLNILPPRTRPPLALELALYRVAQAVLDHAADHHAHSVMLTMRPDADGLILSLQVQGRAPALDRPAIADALARLTRLGGEIDQTATPDRVTLTLRISPAPPVDLTPRERDVLRLLADGLSDRAIAEALIISPRTVNFHLGNVYTKLGVTSRTEAVRYALRHGIGPA